MASLVCFHAHPDDESIATGGVIAKAARDGHRVTLVFATRGDHGEVDEDFLEDDETLRERRTAETRASARVLGAERVEFLDYVDSGMMGEATNEAPECFWQADLDEAASRLAAVLDDVGADVLTVYDDHGGYGHPDHIQVHRVGIRAAEQSGTSQVLEATMNRDHVREMIRRGAEQGMDTTEAPDLDEGAEFGSPDEVITTRVDVRDLIELKRASMRAHASQIAETSMFLKMPDDVFREVFGWEFFIRRGVPAHHRDDDLFAGLG